MRVRYATYKRSVCALILSVAVLAASAPAGAQTFSTNGLFSTSDRSIWANGPAFVVDTGNQFLGTSWDIGKTVGGVDCFLGACFGAQIGAQTSGKFGLDYALRVNSGSFGLLYPGTATITVPTVITGTPTSPGPVTIGSNFQGLTSIQTNTSPVPINARLQVTGPTLQASLGVDALFHGFAGAEVCVGVCVGPALGPIDFNASQSIASINQGNSGQLTVLGQTVSAHQNFSGLGGLINASVNLPKLDGSSATTPGGVSGGVLTSTARDSILAVNANLAQIAADAFGLPIPLSGNLGPFGYNLLQSNAGVAFDLAQTLSFTPFATGSLLFSSPVTPEINGVMLAPTTRIDFNVGDDVTFLPGQVSGLGIQPLIDLHGIVSNTTDLVVNGDINVQALGASIAGQSIGPLINGGLPAVDLGHLNLFNKPPFQDDIGTILGNPIDLDFGCQTTIGTEFPQTLICASTKYVNAGPIFIGANGERFDVIDLVSCDSTPIGNVPNCTTTFSNLSGPYINGPSGPIFEVGNPLDFAFNSPGLSTTDAGDNALLESLGFQTGLPPFSIPDGAPLSSFAVPEPGSVALLGIGMALIALVSIRRRRRT
jgi:PEP-CTERM motif-containing protein